MDQNFSRLVVEYVEASHSQNNEIINLISQKMIDIKTQNPSYYLTQLVLIIIDKSFDKNIKTHSLVLIRNLFPSILPIPYNSANNPLKILSDESINLFVNSIFPFLSHESSTRYHSMRTFALFVAIDTAYSKEPVILTGIMKDEYKSNSVLFLSLMEVFLDVLERPFQISRFLMYQMLGYLGDTFYDACEDIKHRMVHLSIINECVKTMDMEYDTNFITNLIPRLIFLLDVDDLFICVIDIFVSLASTSSILSGYQDQLGAYFMNFLIKHSNYNVNNSLLSRILIIWCFYVEDNDVFLNYGKFLADYCIKIFEEFSNSPMFELTSSDMVEYDDFYEVVLELFKELIDRDFVQSSSIIVSSLLSNFGDYNIQQKLCILNCLISAEKNIFNDADIKSVLCNALILNKNTSYLAINILSIFTFSEVRMCQEIVVVLLEIIYSQDNYLSKNASKALQHQVCRDDYPFRSFIDQTLKHVDPDSIYPSVYIIEVYSAAVKYFDHDLLQCFFAGKTPWILDLLYRCSNTSSSDLVASALDLLSNLAKVTPTQFLVLLDDIYTVLETLLSSESCNYAMYTIGTLFSIYKGFNESSNIRLINNLVDIIHNYNQVELFVSSIYTLRHVITFLDLLDLVPQILESMFKVIFDIEFPRDSLQFPYECVRYVVQKYPGAIKSYEESLCSIVLFGICLFTDLLQVDHESASSILESIMSISVIVLPLLDDQKKEDMSSALLEFLLEIFKQKIDLLNDTSIIEMFSLLSYLVTIYPHSVFNLICTQEYRNMIAYGLERELCRQPITEFQTSAAKVLSSATVSNNITCS